MIQSRYNRPLHLIALATAIATFPLIFMGGLVTSHGAGMSVPDWPNSWGYNMFLFPPRLWRGGIFYEHTHRLYAASIVGPLCIATCICAWLVEKRRWVRWLGTGLLAFVVLQGVIGGLRVVLVKLDLAIVHACFAQAFFCLAALASIVTSRWWIEASPASESRHGLIAACAFATLAIYLQLIVGATMRHYEAGLAVPDFPLAYGQVLPKTDPQSLHRINQQRIWEIDLPTVTARQIWLHMGHRFGAAVVTLATIAASGMILFHHRGQRKLLVPAVLLLVLLPGQIALGAATVLYRKPADVASAHVAVGALTLLTTFVLLVRSVRLFATPRAAMARSREVVDPVPQGVVMA